MHVSPLCCSGAHRKYGELNLSWAHKYSTLAQILMSSFPAWWALCRIYCSSRRSSTYESIICSHKQRCWLGAIGFHQRVSQWHSPGHCE